jgi:hypothetical protein
MSGESFSGASVSAVMAVSSPAVAEARGFDARLLEAALWFDLAILIPRLIAFGVPLSRQWIA